MENKRGQGLSTNAIILIILGVVVLVMLILGFSIGWKKVLPFLSNENVDGVVQGCQASCAAQSTYGYCSQQRVLVDAESNEFTDSCNNFTNGTINVAYPNYGIQNCSTITC